MLYDINWPEDGTYRPNELNSPKKFFNDCLENSKEFDLQLGYFSSATISVLANSFATFISNGGKMRLVINHIVSEKDKEAINKGINGDIIDCFDLSNFEELRKTFDEYQQQFFDCLAFLIYNKRIDIRIIKPKNENGIAHTKQGQFRDGIITAAFTGSANFTINGFFNNLEEISISISDSSDLMVQKRIENQRKEFESIMSKEKQDIDYLSPDKLISAIKANYVNKDIEELLDVESKLKLYKQNSDNEVSLHDSDDLEIEYNIEPQFPYPSGPREYQKEAFENWRNNNQKGLFAMATGTGKTITSLNCLYEIYKRKGYYKALILVPTLTLLNQWEEECRKFKFGNIIKVNSKNPNWVNEFDRIYFNEKYQNNNIQSYIIISTYASYSKSKVFEKLNSLDKIRLLFIADEAHNMGSESMLKKLKQIPYIRRIGLSATPDRQYDGNSNSKLKDFFGANEKYTYEYSMSDAIHGANPVLCKYYYYPHVIRLTYDEMQLYLELSEKISKYFNYDSESFDKKDEVLKRLLLARKRIIHKASNKLLAFQKIINDRFKEKSNLNFTLVYVPEGTKPDYWGTEDDFDNSEYINDDFDAEKLIDEYTAKVLEVDKHVTVRKFTSGQKDRDDLLNKFALGKVQVLTSMKCLDEGVDVPRSELAIFCSSTGNSRQFIQRRGRVLRMHPQKEYAILHDLVVVPEVGMSFNSYRMERSLLKGELMRVKNFADLSENPSYSEIELRSALDYYGLSL